MLIPSEAGGNKFSTRGRSQIVQKLSSCLEVLEAMILLFGDGELLLNCGTESQKKTYLPKLASGEMIPCFG